MRVDRRTPAVLAALALGLAPGARAAPAEGSLAPARAVSAETPVIARLAVAHTLRFAPKILVTGDLRPEQTAQLGFAVPGTMARLEVRRGQFVAAGEALASLDAAAAKATVQQAEAGLEAALAQVAGAEAQLRMAEDAVARLEKLQAAAGATDMQVVQAQGQRDAARNGVAAAKANVAVVKAQREQAEVHLRNHVLRAPFAGLVTRLPDGAGMVVGPGVPMFVVEATQTLLLETSVTIEEASQIRTGTRLEVTAVGTRAKTADAAVRTVVPSADPMSHRVPVVIAVPNRDGRFVAHGYARAQLQLGGEREAVKVPAGALVQRDGAFSVWVADEDDRARQARVKLRSQEADFAVVEAEDGPLADGARVVDLPPLDLVEGTRLVGAVAK